MKGISPKAPIELSYQDEANNSSPDISLAPHNPNQLD